MAENGVLEKGRGVHGEKLHVHEIGEGIRDGFDYAEEKLLVDAVHADGGAEEKRARKDFRIQC